MTPSGIEPATSYRGPPQARLDTTNVFSVRSLATPIKLRLRSFEQYYIGNIKKDLKNKLDEGRGVQSGFNWLKKGQTAGSLEQRNRPHTSTN